MPKTLQTFKIAGSKLKRTLRSKMQKPEKFSLKILQNKIKVLPSPIQSESDNKEYRVIRLENGLLALLISDMNSLRTTVDEDSAAASSTDESSEEDDSEDSRKYESDENFMDGTDGDDDSMSDEGGRPMRRENDEEKLAACALCVGVGSFSDPPNIQGLAHFVEHMVFMGSKKYPKENDFDSFIKKKGGSDNAMTESERTTFYFEIQEDDLAEAMDKFSQFFVAPLMKQEAMQRERESIQSEFAMSLPVDSNRKEQLVAGMMPEGHPARNFMWGDSRSLAAPMGPTDSDLYAGAHAFRQRHYSAHRMTLAVQARMPLALLEKYVISTFGLIPSNNLPPDDFSKYYFTPETITNDFHAMYYVKPINKISQLEVTWCMRSFVNDYKSKPQHYVGWILGHEGPGSLLSYLRKKVWALEIYAGTTGSSIDDNSLLCLFSATIVLTKEGLNNKDKVLDCLFGYMNMLREQCPNERIFEEMKTIEEKNFRFEKEPQPCDNVEILVECMHMYPPEHFITGREHFYDYNPELIMYVVENMVPEKVNIMLLSQEHPVPIVYDQVEEWFGTEYKKIDIPKESVERWKTMKPFEEFHLPEPNIFITDNFDLISLPDELATAMKVLEKNKAKHAPSDEESPSIQKPAEKSKTRVGRSGGKKPAPEKEEKNAQYKEMNTDIRKIAEANAVAKSIIEANPILLRNDDLMEVWYKADYKFRLPNAFIYVEFVSPLMLKSAKDYCLVDLWCMLLNQQLTEKLYAADMAGLGYSVVPLDKGIAVRLHGFSQKLPVLVNEITKGMKGYEQHLTEELFQAIKNEQCKNYQNCILKPNKLTKDVRFSLILETYWTHNEKLQALQQVTFGELCALGEVFCAKLRAQVLVQGNFHKAPALYIANLILENLQWGPLSEEDRPKIRVLAIPHGERSCRVQSFNLENVNSNITNYYQSGPYTLKASCIIDILMMLMEEPVFHTLRTKEQLGYNVYSMCRYTYGVLGFSITVNTQADKYTADHVNSRIRAFLQVFSKELAGLSDDCFQQIKESLIKIKRCVDVELKDEVSRNWAEIIALEYNFNRQAEEIECLKQITKKEMQNWFIDHTANGSNFKVISIQIIGNKKEDQPSLDDESKLSQSSEDCTFDSKYLLKFLDGTNNDPNGENQDKEFITDLENFKQALEVYPEKRTEIPISTPLL